MDYSLPREYFFFRSMFAAAGISPVFALALVTGDKFRVLGIRRTQAFRMSGMEWAALALIMVPAALLFYFLTVMNWGRLYMGGLFTAGALMGAFCGKVLHVSKGGQPERKIQYLSVGALCGYVAALSGLVVFVFGTALISV